MFATIKLIQFSSQCVRKYSFQSSFWDKMVEDHRLGSHLYTHLVPFKVNLRD